MTPPAAQKSPKTPERAQTAARRWLVRFGLALFIGIAIGGGTGVFVVDTLEPGRPNSVDSLQVMLDSIARGRIPPAESGGVTKAAPSAAPSPDTTPAPEEQATIPSLVDLEEGAARNAILDAGLEVGEVRFQASSKPAGTVIGTTPAAGTAVARNSAVGLVLSDGRPPTDTMPTPRAGAFHEAPFGFRTNLRSDSRLDHDS